MSTLEPPSTFVQRCREALAEYQRLRFLGLSHEQAIRPLMEAMNPTKKVERDVRQAQAGE